MLEKLRRGRYVFKIMVKRGEGWEVVKTVKTSRPVETVEYAGHSFIADYSKAVIDNNTYVLFYEVSSSSPLTFKQGEKIDSRLLHTVLKNSVIEKVFKPFSWWDILLPMLVGAAVGLVIGTVVL